MLASAALYERARALAKVPARGAERWAGVVARARRRMAHCHGNARIVGFARKSSSR